MANRKTFWIAKSSDGKTLGVFSTKKRAEYFLDGQDFTLEKLSWNGFYYSDKPIEYNPFDDTRVKTFVPMF
jgi:hypothetical protein